MQKLTTIFAPAATKVNVKLTKIDPEKELVPAEGEVSTLINIPIQLQSAMCMKI